MAGHGVLDVGVHVAGEHQAHRIEPARGCQPELRREWQPPSKSERSGDCILLQQGDGLRFGTASKLALVVSPFSSPRAARGGTCCTRGSTAFRSICGITTRSTSKRRSCSTMNRGPTTSAILIQVQQPKSLRRMLRPLRLYIPAPMVARCARAQST